MKIFFLFSLLLLQLIAGFLFPVGGNYHFLTLDSQSYLESAADFSAKGLEGRFTLARPLYSFLIFLSSIPFRIFNTFSDNTILGLAVATNFILLALATILFFKFLTKFFPQNTAFLSSILLIFSPYVRNSLTQPLAEMLMILAVVASIYCLANYLKKPAGKKLVIYSLLIGFFMLGKMFFAITIFILLLSIYFKRYKEGIIFFAVHLIPFLLWYLWVVMVWQMPYRVAEVESWGMGVWLLQIFSSPLAETTKYFLRAIPYFLTALFYGFYFLPVIFSFIGKKELPFKSKNLIYFISIISLFILMLGMNVYTYRHAFLLFPIILPAAVLGIKKLGPYLSIIIIGLIIVISNINIFDYYSQVHWSNWPIPEFVVNIFKNISGKY